MTEPQTMTQAAYARRRGLARQNVHTLAREGRIVLNNAGAVVVDESDELLSATQQRPARSSNAAAVRELTEARLRSEQAKAEKLELEVGVLAGTLCERKAVERAAADLGAQLRAALERLPHRLAAELLALSDHDEIAAVIGREVGNILENFTAGSGLAEPPRADE